ncbi:hypothetical protein GCM10022384_15800 [Streptomyces marokkonensis]|uniref:Uncharacterized protein n=1 Tax=Streptomyces marokkonensis TaxID=324855 RepID=A0ABP7PGH0_9ACTN
MGESWNTRQRAFRVVRPRTEARLSSLGARPPGGVHSVQEMTAAHAPFVEPGRTVMRTVTVPHSRLNTAPYTYRAAFHGRPPAPAGRA